MNKVLNEMRELVMRRLGDKHSGQREEMARAEALQMEWVAVLKDKQGGEYGESRMLWRVRGSG